MAADIPTTEPKTHQAGTTLKFDRDLPDFPSDTWTLTYELRSTVNAPITITAAANGTGFRVNEAYGTTVDWNDGDYLMVGFVTSATERHEVYRDVLTILKYAGIDETFEWRSYAARMLAKIEDIISGRMERDDASYSINGRSFTPKTDADLLAARNYFKAEVAKELRSKKGGKILGRFKAPR